VPHTSPWQRVVQQCGSETANGFSMNGSLPLQCLDISQGIDTALNRIVLSVDGAATGRFPRMHFDERAAMIEADRLLIGERRGAD
jgi:hypothetical protein